MATLFAATLQGGPALDPDAAARRVLGRAVRPRGLATRLATAPSWTEVSIAASAIHPDARASTSEEFFVRLVAEARERVGDGTNPVVDAFEGHVWDDDFEVDPYRFDPTPDEFGRFCPLMLVELDWAPDHVSAVCLVPTTWFAAGHAVAFESTAWGAGRRFRSRLAPDEERAAGLRRRGVEVRLVEAIERVAPDHEPGSYQSAIHLLAWYDGELFGAPRSGKLLRFRADWHAEPFGRKISCARLFSAHGSLWVVTDRGKASVVENGKLVARASAPGEAVTTTDAAQAALDPLPLAGEGGLGNVVGRFDALDAVWFAMESGTFVEVHDGEPRLYVIANVEPRSDVLAACGVLTNDGVVLAGTGVHEVLLGTLDGARQTAPVSLA